jgi:plastocyanin
LAGVVAAGLLLGAFTLSCGGKSSSPTSPTGGGGLELNSGSIAPGAAYAHMFNTAGVFNYHCTVPGHSAMTGSVTVNSGGSPTAVPVSFGATISAIGNQTCNVGSTVTWTNASTTMAHTITSF